MPSGNVTWKISGLKELDAKLRDIAPKLQAKALRGAASAGVRVIRDDARQRVNSRAKYGPLLPGEKRIGGLRDAIRFTTSVKPATGLAIAKVFVSIKRAWYGRLVEGGTKAHIIKAKKAKALRLPSGIYALSVKHPGSTPKPFMQPAANTKAQAAVAAVTAKLKLFFDTYHG